MKYQYDTSDIDYDQKHWSDWNARRPKSRITINNYLSAVVFSLSAYLVVATHMA